MSQLAQVDLFPDVRSRPEDDSDCRYTPRALITQLHAEHRFTVDAASAADSPAAQIIGRFWSKADDGLSQPWTRERVFCNPPWSDIEPWVRKAWRETEQNGCPLVVMLLPAWTDRGWWHELVEPSRDGKPSAMFDTATLTTAFLRRMPFGHPGNPDAVSVGQPPFFCVLLTWRRGDHQQAGEETELQRCSEGK